MLRLRREYELILKSNNPDFAAHPIKDDLFNWHFTMKGMPDTPYAGGFYHGAIKLPPEYPYKPPSISFINVFK